MFVGCLAKVQTIADILRSSQSFRKDCEGV